MDDPEIPEEYKNKPVEWYKEEYLVLLKDKIVDSKRKAIYYQRNKDRIKAKAKERRKTAPKPKARKKKLNPRPTGRPRKYPISLEISA